MKERPITEEQLQWLRENFDKYSNHKLRVSLHTTEKRLVRLMAEMNLVRTERAKGQRLPIAKKVKKKYVYLDEDAPGQYCRQCLYYQQGGICKKFSKDVGALWQKRCFEQGEV